MLNPRPGLQSPGDQIRREIVGLQMPAVGRAAEEAGPVDGVSAVLRDHVDADAATGRLGRDAAGLIGRFRDERVIDVVLHLAVDQVRLRRHAVEQHGIVQRGVAVRRHVGLLGLLRPAYVGNVQPDAGHQRADGLQVARTGNRVNEIAAHDVHLRRILHVDHGRRARHRHRFLERTDLHLGVDRYRHVGRDVDTFALERVEPGQRERHRVGARADVDDGVAALTVGHHGARLFDEDRAGGFDRHARQHGARRVLHDTGNRALGVDDGGGEDDGERPDNEWPEKCPATHTRGSLSVPSNEPSVQTPDESVAREMTRHSAEAKDVCKMNYSDRSVR